MKSVTMLPYALAAESTTQTIYVPKEDSLAASIMEEKRNKENEYVEFDVECRRLSEYLDEPVDFLKIDIEGVEDIVLEEARDKLCNVRSLCCEYHHGDTLKQNRLVKILQLLNEAGFDYHVGKALNFRRRTERKALSYADSYSSFMIWAKNKRP